MNWDAIGAIAETVGATGVIITLAYLAIQIRNSAEINASALRQSFYDYTTRQMLHGTDSKEFSELMAKASMTNNPLSPGEKMQMLRLLQAVFVGYQGAYFQYKNGALGEEDWTSCRALLRSFWYFEGRGFSELWEQFKTGGFLDEGFVEECELVREEAKHYVRELENKGLSFED
jgi:hypothetical protein